MPADDAVFAAFYRLRGIGAGDPQNAAAWAKDAALLARAAPELLEAALPIGRFRGFWPEVIRCCLAIGAGREPPPPRDWRLPDTKPRRKVTAKSPATRQKKSRAGLSNAQRRRYAPGTRQGTQCEPSEDARMAASGDCPAVTL